jgi:hypothetical protein
MKKHLGFSCLAYCYFGIWLTVQHIGIKAGLRLTLTLSIFISSMILFAVVVFTSLEKVKRAMKFYDDAQKANQNNNQ